MTFETCILKERVRKNIAVSRNSQQSLPLLWKHLSFSGGEKKKISSSFPSQFSFLKHDSVNILRGVRFFCQSRMLEQQWFYLYLHVMSVQIIRYKTVQKRGVKYVRVCVCVCVCSAHVRLSFSFLFPMSLMYSTASGTVALELIQFIHRQDCALLSFLSMHALCAVF